ncbi:MAG TPA: Ig-like domain-containing protein, partial [Gemmatimonadales bacterium]
MSRVSVSGISVPLLVGATGHLVATATNAAGQALSRTASWSSSAPDVATVDTNGTVTAVAAGTTTITATIDTKSGSVQVSVNIATLPLATGRVQLPAGSTLALTSLTVSSVDGTSPVAADGSYTVPERSASPAIVYLTDAAGNVVMLGFSSSGSGPGEISTTTTAQILLFYALGAENLPPDQYQQTFAMIAGSGTTAGLAAIVGGGIAGDPTAITTGNANIDAGVESAVNTLVPGGAGIRSSRPLAPAPPAISRTPITVARSRQGRQDVGQVLVQPSDPQSGVSILNNPTGDGIVAMNTFRRHCEFSIYKTGTTDLNGVVNDFTLVQPFGGAHDLPSVTKINGIFGTFTDLLNNKVAYAPVSSDAVSLPLDPDTKETRYEVVVVGYSNPLLQSAVLTDPRYAQQVATIQSTYDDLTLDAFVREFVLNFLVTATFAPNDVKSILGDPTAVSSLTIDLVKLVKSTPGILDQLKAGKPVDAFAALAVAIANSSGLRKQLLNSLADLPTIAQFGKNIANGDQILGSLMKINTLLKGAELGLSAGDIARVIHDWGEAHEADVWSAKVEAPAVHLNPQQSTVSVENSISKLTVSVVGVDGSALRYIWSTTGHQGHLESANSPTPLGTGPIPDTQVAYVADLLNLIAGHADTVTVTVVLASDPSAVLGTATATVTGTIELNCGPLPPPRTSAPIGIFAPTIAVNTTDYHAGDTLTATIHIPATGGEAFLWDVIVFNNDPAIKPRIAEVLTVDGQPPALGSVRETNGSISVSGTPNSQGTAETHVVAFRIKTPIGIDGNPEVECAAGSTVGGSFGGPYVIGDVYVRDGFNNNWSITYFNA